MWSSHLCMAGFVGVASPSPPNGRACPAVGRVGPWWPLVVGCGCLVRWSLDRRAELPSARCAPTVGVPSCGAVTGPSPMVGPAVVVREPPSLFGVLRWCVAPLMVGGAVVLRGSSHCGACCVGAGSPSWWGVLWCCVAPLMVGRVVVVRAPLMVACAVLVLGPPHGGATCVGEWPPSIWGVLWWCVVLLMVERAVVLRGPPHGGACFGGCR